MIRRIAGMVSSPRATLAEASTAPVWGTWLVILGIWAVCGGALLSTDVGRQAVVDERVRMIEAFGGSVTDAEYAAFQASPPWWVYLTSGSRTLLMPPVTLLTALGVWLVTRAEGVPASMSQALAVVVSASVMLLVGQLVAAPLHYVHESLTSPLNLAAILPAVEEGTVPARFFGTMDLFALWWAGLLATGLAVLTGRRSGRYLGPLAAAFAVFAAIVAALSAAMGGA